MTAGGLVVNKKSEILLIFRKNMWDLPKGKIENNESFKIMWDQFCTNELIFPEDFKISDGATRATGGSYLNLIGAKNKFVLGGSADLAASTKQVVSDKTYSSENRTGQNIDFGIREHSMAAIVNGINLHSKLFAYGSTFLVFSDYMRPSIRLASLMNLNSSYVFTHDSVYLGEDGPTHQPIEHLMSLRLIPGLDVIRPSNSIEILHSYRYLFSNTKNPKALSLTRQNLEYLDFSIDYDKFLNGGYVVSDGKDITIFASGSELNLAFDLKDRLNKYSVKIVSVPILNKLTPENYKLFINLIDLKIIKKNITSFEIFQDLVNDGLDIKNLERDASSEWYSPYFDNDVLKIIDLALKEGYMYIDDDFETFICDNDFTDYNIISYFQYLKNKNLDDIFILACKHQRYSLIQHLIKLGQKLSFKIIKKYDLDYNKFIWAEDIEGELFCVICYTNSPNILFLPCGHLISCAQCSINMKKECPYDHIPINKYVVLKGNTEDERLNCVKCKTNKVQKIYTKCQHSTCDKCSIKSKCPVCFKRSLSKKIYLI